MRVRAYEREQPWAPRYVGNELAGTRQAADHHRRTAALRQAEADAAADPDRRGELLREATDAAALAEVLEARAGELQIVDDARARWLAHTAGSRANAERSKAELAARHVDDTDEQQVTAEEWLAEHGVAVADDERHREITPADVAADRDHWSADADVVVEVAVTDIRDVAAAEPAPVDEDAVRVPTPGETSDALERAQRALAEIRARDDLDAQEDAAHRADELARWHTADLAAADEAATEHEAVDEWAPHLR